MRRRKYLQLAGAGGAAGLAGCVDRVWNPLSVNIFQTDNLASYCDVVADDEHHSQKVAKTYLEDVLRPIVKASDYWTHLDVDIVNEPVDQQSDGAHIVIRSVEFDQWIDDRDNISAEESNILLDMGGYVPTGIAGLALLWEGTSLSGCDPENEASNSSVVQYADRLTEVDPDDDVVKEIPVIQDEEPLPVEDFLTPFVASAVPHEVIHNLCAPHLHGNAWRGFDTPSHVLDDEPEEDMVYSSLLMAFYVLKYGGAVRNSCGRQIEEFEHYYTPEDELVFEDNLTVLTKPSPCTVASVAEYPEM